MRCQRKLCKPWSVLSCVTSYCICRGDWCLYWRERGGAQGILSLYYLSDWLISNHRYTGRRHAQRAITCWCDELRRMIPLPRSVCSASRVNLVTRCWYCLNSSHWNLSGDLAMSASRRHSFSVRQVARRPARGRLIGTRIYDLYDPSRPAGRWQTVGLRYTMQWWIREDWQWGSFSHWWWCIVAILQEIFIN